MGGASWLCPPMCRRVPVNLELSLDAASLMSFPSFPGKDHGFFFFKSWPTSSILTLTHLQARMGLLQEAHPCGLLPALNWPLVVSALFLKPRTKPQLIHCTKMNAGKKIHRKCWGLLDFQILVFRSRIPVPCGPSRQVGPLQRALGNRNSRVGGIIPRHCSPVS